MADEDNPVILPFVRIADSNWRAPLKLEQTYSLGSATVTIRLYSDRIELVIRTDRQPRGDVA